MGRLRRLGTALERAAGVQEDAREIAAAAGPSSKALYDIAHEAFSTGKLPSGIKWMDPTGAPPYVEMEKGRLALERIVRTKAEAGAVRVEARLRATADLNGKTGVTVEGDLTNWLANAYGRPMWKPMAAAFRAVVGEREDALAQDVRKWLTPANLLPLLVGPRHVEEWAMKRQEPARVSFGDAIVGDHFNMLCDPIEIWVPLTIDVDVALQRVS